ncbi:MAG: nucleoside-triphosphatase [Nitrospinota bacterium]|jgi:nucleoside-triphosphatase|nr:nucleoside-triphosphatase [Nitrospinota bacterium]MDP7581252.1 nucleoside-triphosphatase [Nitrospinota bacterium]HJN03177.1 nucleoside-triphosphatase [Nitrospinota bacterium]
MKNIFLTGPPSSGKTTVIKKIITGLKRPAKGFYTEEIRVDGKRQGFKMITLAGKEGLLGHRDIKSDYTVSKYGVSIENIDNIAVPAIIPDNQSQIIILDEIGKMECFSKKFKEAALQALDSNNTVIGTIAISGTEFIRKIKERCDMKIIEATESNRHELSDKILSMT